MKYLSKEGVTHLWNRIKAKFLYSSNTLGVKDGLLIVKDGTANNRNVKVLASGSTGSVLTCDANGKPLWAQTQTDNTAGSENESGNTKLYLIGASAQTNSINGIVTKSNHEIYQQSGVLHVDGLGGGNAGKIVTPGGAICFGYDFDNGGSIDVYAEGSFALGTVGDGGNMIAVDNGSVSFGYASGGTIEAEITGSVAHGLSYDGGQILSSGAGSHAEGFTMNGGTICASGEGSHAEGINTLANGEGSHAEGIGFSGITEINVVMHIGGTCDNKTLLELDMAGLANPFTEFNLIGSKIVMPSGTSVTYNSGFTVLAGKTLVITKATPHDGIQFEDGYYHWDSVTVTYGGKEYVLDNAINHNASNLTSINVMLKVLPYSNSVGKGSHSEGYETQANGDYSHAEGWGSKSNGLASHAEGFATVTKNIAEHAVGSHNSSHSKNPNDFGKSFSGNTLFSVGNGTTRDTKSNAFEIMQNGDIYINGLTGSKYDGGMDSTVNQNDSLQHIINNKGTVKVITPGAGLLNGLTKNPITSVDTLNVALVNQIQNTLGATKSTSSNGGLYAVELDKNGKLAVRVPWVNTNTTCGSLNNQNKLYLVGTLGQAASTTSYSNAGVYTSGSSIYATNGFFQTSDIRKKNIIKRLDVGKALEMIENCQTVLYTLKDDMNHKEQVGMLAQEVEKYYPELVSRDVDGTLSLDYARLVVIQMTAFKGLCERINKLENILKK